MQKKIARATSDMAIAVVHQSGLKLPSSEKATVRTLALWRLKNWKKHPTDPGWDDGRYCRCHRRFRDARKGGETVVDCVNDGNAEAHVVRSYFRIEKIEPCQLREGNDLLFRTYYFCDDTPYRLKRPIGPSGMYLTAREFTELKSHPSYHVYEVSATRGPKSIAKEDWARMLGAKKRSKRRHTCP